VAPWYLKRRAARLGPEGMVREMMRLCCANPARIPSDVFAAHVAITAQRAERMPWATSAFLDAARSLLNALRKRSQFFAMAARIGAPTLIVQGARDRLVPLVATQALMRHRPDWTLAVIDDSGHVPMLEHAERFVELVEPWLAASPTPARATDPSHR
jgi:pimeloyl-ACP methyl ester carboxylesterase